MSNVAVYTAARQHLEAYWDQSKAPLSWENEAYDPPSGSPWIYVQLDDSDFEQVSFGSGSAVLNRWRETGAILVFIAVPINTGTLVADSLVEDMRNLLRGLILPPDDDGEEIILGDMPTVGRGKLQNETGIWYGIWLYVGWTKG